MNFQALSLEGAYYIDLDKKDDMRGYFARTFCVETFLQKGISFNVSQSSLSSNAKKATLRGLHYQCAPHAEKKMIYCLKGRIFDVIVDIRPDSSTRGQWFSVELSAEQKNALFIPEGFAHGFQTLCDDCEVLYFISTPYAPNSARGICWSDPSLGINWPFSDPIMSGRDQQFPCLNP